MTKFKLFHLKNEMLVATFLANFVGVFFVNAMLYVAEGFPADKQMWQQPVPFWVDALFTPLAFSFVTVMILLYEKPIRRYLDLTFRKDAIPQDLETTARQRLLNEPFVLITLSFSMWLLAATVYPLIHWAYGPESKMIQRTFYNAIINGVITVTVAFFMLEHILQKKLAPLFFPNGGLTTVPQTLRIRIRTRLVALLFACNLIPLITIMLNLQRITGTQMDLSTAIQQLRSAIFANAFIFLIIGIFLTILLARNLSIPFKEIVQTLKGVRNGHFEKKVQVTTNDEIGYTGDVINEMTEGLKERQRMQHSLDIAKEVQQNLLPRHDPEIDGLDIAGTSIYCEETGGDYYDYLMTGEDDQNKICVVVGDVADHGIPSALLMTTARAFLRQRTSRSGELDQVVADVNLQLTRDVEDSGRFMTLFICEIDPNNNIIHWVNAGHDPAIIYDRESGKFEDLSGNALPLGVSETATYQKFDKQILPGQIIMMGTDGIWEAQSPQGEMFGKERFKDIIRHNAGRPAKDIIQTVIKEVDRFCHPLEKADDVTLVVTKIT
ncbi:MAG: SpoIIE family protein phosphatase [Desulfobacterales bacterium]|jgi:sigma-B regulation protein RsbU (phosphoserine phosphatase)